MDQSPILGLPQHFFHGQNERVDELNDRISSRHFPDSPLQPNFDPRPVPTKYAHFPIINRRTPLKEPIVPYLDYHMSVNFNPGSQNAPPSGYFNNIHVENRLRNQHFGLQNGADQSVYVPSSNSDMYRVVLPSGSQLDPQPFPSMFEQGTFDTSSHNESPMIGKDVLHNHTRTQLRNL